MRYGSERRNERKRERYEDLILDGKIRLLKKINVKSC